MSWNIYLSGEIHTDWRERIIDGAKSAGILATFTSAVTDHSASDAAGDLLSPSSQGFWRDHKSAKVNAIRTRTLIQKCDIAVVRFGDQYKQWNAAFDAGYASALRKSLVIMHDPQHQHALKEVDAAALAVVEETKQVVEILDYVINGNIPRS